MVHFCYCKWQDFIFLWLSSIPLCVCTTSSLSIHWSVDIGYFRILAIVNNGAVNICCCCCSVAQSCPTLCNLMTCSTPGFTVLDHFRVCSNSYPLSWWCHPTIPPLLSSLSSPAFSGLFQWVSFALSISPSNEYLGLISFRIDRFGLLAVQGTHKNLL